ncbi:MAG: Farnesyl diphosphate synthase [Candidatus Anoxychlamydiales bacterium]|nr:Farnesyl diphosphate synthase [Candidatus Anoxychlamydiales bacterium]
MKNKIEKINNKLSNLFEVEKKPHKILYEAINYSISSKAKRLRPLLTLLICEAYNVNLDSSIDASIAIELIHTYSLIHDDLPCMDDDDLRRGKPSLHKKYNEWLAILTGDSILTYAFELICNIKNLSHEKKIKLISSLSKYAGKDHLIAGQVIDLMSENSNINFETLKFMHVNKTASLFICAAEFGAILCDATKSDFENLKLFAYNLGLAFQIRDDILDENSTTKDLGKKIKSDIKKNKSTALTILGLEKAKNLEKELYDLAYNHLSKLSINTQSLNDFIKILK